MKLNALLLTLLIINVVTAQKIEFGKVSKAELLETSYDHDKSAKALVLYKGQSTYLNSTNGVNTLITEIHERIKIYSNEGFEHATEHINLYTNNSDKESVQKIKAYTYNLENDKILSYKLDKDQIFETEVNFNHKQVKFTMPNVKEGSVIEFKYIIKSPYIWNIDEFKFQYDIPIKTLEAEIRTPEGFNFRAAHKGYISFYPQESKEKDHRLGMPVNIKRYVLNNVPAVKKEPYVDNIDNYKAGVLFELSSIELPQFYRNYAHSWQDVAEAIGSSDDYKN